MNKQIWVVIAVLTLTFSPLLADRADVGSVTDIVGSATPIASQSTTVTFFPSGGDATLAVDVYQVGSVYTYVYALTNVSHGDFLNALTVDTEFAVAGLDWGVITGSTTTGIGSVGFSFTGNLTVDGFEIPAGEKLVIYVQSSSGPHEVSFVIANSLFAEGMTLANSVPEPSSLLLLGTGLLGLVCSRKKRS